MDCHATASAVSRNDRKNAESQNAVSLEKVDSNNEAQNLSEPQTPCFIAQNKQGTVSLENKRSAVSLVKPNPHHQHPSDSKILEIESSHALQAAGFLMRNCSFQGAGEGIYLGDNEQARAAESTIYRAKPNPPKLVFFA